MQYNGPNVSKFGWICSETKKVGHAFYDRPLFETAQFVVLPSLGSIVPGWLLIVPKLKVARFADLPTSTETKLMQLVLQLGARTSIRFGKPYLFEHGGYVGSDVSCGVDQAHLHLVPLDFDLLEVARREPDQTWKKCRNPLCPPPDKELGEYLFVSSLDVAFASEVTKPVSQWFRRLIARESGKPNEWNYKEHAFLDNIRTTLEVMSEYVE